MPTFSYRCENCGSFEKFQKIIDHKFAMCDYCDVMCNQIITHAPMLDTEGMADAGCPSSFFKSGDRMTERHLSADRAGDWASRDSIEFTDSAGEDRKGDFLKAFAQKVAATE